MFKLHLFIPLFEYSIKFQLMLVDLCWISRILEIIFRFKVYLFCLVTLARNTSEQLFANIRSISNLNLNKNMKTYIKYKHHKNRLQNIKQTEPQEKYLRGCLWLR